MTMLKHHFIRNGTKLLLFLNVIVAEAMFRQRAYIDKSVDLQVAIKIGVWVATFSFCIFFFRTWIGRLLRIDMFLQMLLLVFIFISCLYAPHVSYSFASAFSLATVLLLLLMASSVLDNHEILGQIILASSAVMAISLIVYFAAPDFGRMKLWENGNLVTGARLSGITGTANACGYIAALTLLLLYYWRHTLPRLSLFFGILVILNLACLLMSHSRTAVAALVLGITIAAITKASPTRMALLFLGICLAMIGMATLNADATFEWLARSGDALEIQSGSGRTAIWATTLDLIGQRPLFGWGYAASNALIPAQIHSIGFIANHAHNAFLQIALCIGFAGLLLFMALMVTKLYFAIKYSAQLNIALIFFLLIDGLTEPIAFHGPATATSLVLATVLSLHYRHTHETTDTAYQQRLPGSAAA